MAGVVKKASENLTDLTSFFLKSWSCFAWILFYFAFKNFSTMNVETSPAVDEVPRNLIHAWRYDISYLATWAPYRGNAYCVSRSYLNDLWQPLHHVYVKLLRFDAALWSRIEPRLSYFEANALTATMVGIPWEFGLE